MRKITADELSKILKEHERWIATDWKGGEKADLSNIDLSGANLSGVRLCEANLCGADLSGADLRETDFFRADLSGADLSEADLRGAMLYNADLSGADLSGADLEGAEGLTDLRSAMPYSADLEESDGFLEGVEGLTSREQDVRGKRAEDIRARVNARNIPYLVHFTPIDNVESILKNGLLSRNALGDREYISTDKNRSDGWLDWISASVTFPNYRMFFKKRELLKHVNAWAIMQIKRDVLWELDCKFILTNAASFGIRKVCDDKWSSVEAFEDMFNSAEQRINIPDCFTTDPQAEVMVRDNVPRRYIDMVTVKWQDDANQLSEFDDVRVEINPRLFKWRSDFRYWRKRRLDIIHPDDEIPDDEISDDEIPF
tara:strand:+ start:58 stop:1170 length:1113 start_codon:yes stop_codon:yes gene_type:complete